MTQWVQDYRALMDHRNVQHQDLKIQSASTIAHYQDAIKTARETIASLEKEVCECHQHYHTVERQLLGLIDVLADRVKQLETHIDLEKETSALLKNEMITLRKVNSENNALNSINTEYHADEKLEASVSSKVAFTIGSPQHKTPPWSKQINTSNNITTNTPKISPSSSVVSSSVDHLCDDSFNVVNNWQRPQQYSSTNGTLLVELIRYGNGSIKEIYANGITVIRFPNGDVQTKGNDGSIAYFYSDQATFEIKFEDGRKEYEFPNGQKEEHYDDGSKVVIFPDGTVATINAV
jgi:T-complex protein 10 C-terminus